MSDTDWGMEQEALDTERLDADMQQAGWEREGRAAHAARRAGRCCHSSIVSYRDPPFYPEQAGLAPGQSKCTEGCGRVFASDEDWHRAHRRCDPPELTSGHGARASPAGTVGSGHASPFNGRTRS